MASDDDFARSVHGRGRLFPSGLDDDGAFVVAQGDVVGAGQGCQRPHPLVAVVQGALLLVSVGVPKAYCAILRT